MSQYGVRYKTVQLLHGMFLVVQLHQKHLEAAVFRCLTPALTSYLKFRRLEPSLGGVVVWHSGSTLVLINEVNLHRAWWLNGWQCLGSIPGAGHLSWYVTSHPGQLSLAIPSIPSWVGAMSTSQRAMTPCSWGVKAGMVHVWVATWKVKLCDPLVTHGPYLSTLEIGQ